MNVPDFFWSHKLTPVNYYRYRSTVTDRFIEVEAYKATLTPEEEIFIKRFNDVKIKCLATSLNINPEVSDEEAKIWQKDVWDNKIVIECRTELGHSVFMGCDNGIYCVGLGWEGDRWVKPWPYKEIINPAAELIT
jgi:hypothetical protein